MGQFLAMGLAHEIMISLDDMHSKKISKEELRQEMERTLLFDPKLYDETETDKILLFTIKNQVLETGLIPFLEVLYPIVCSEQYATEYRDLLKLLRSTPVAEWTDLARKKDNYAFQLDEYGEPCYIRFSNDFHPYIRLHCNHLLLYRGDGKIATEGINDFLHFFKYCIHETFKEHPVAKAIRVYITG